MDDYCIERLRKAFQACELIEDTIVLELTERKHASGRQTRQDHRVRFLVEELVRKRREVRHIGAILRICHGFFHSMLILYDH